MSLLPVYDADNIFQKIIAGEMPAVKVFEDEKTLAFMDVFPQSEGHTLIIHKEAHAVGVMDLPSSALQEIIVTVQKVAKAIDNALSPDGLRLVQFNGAAAGQTVFHAHFHVIPTYTNKKEKPHGSEMAPVATLEKIAAQIVKAI